MKAAKRCLSSAEVNPHQALAAYNSLAMTTLRQPNHNPKPNPTLNLTLTLTLALTLTQDIITSAGDVTDYTVWKLLRHCSDIDDDEDVHRARDDVGAGPLFALHCVGSLLLPTLQAWLRRPVTGVNTACWDTTTVANFKHYAGLCVDLIVELVVQFTGLTSSHIHTTRGYLVLRCQHFIFLQCIGTNVITPAAPCRLQDCKN